MGTHLTGLADVWVEGVREKQETRMFAFLASVVGCVVVSVTEMERLEEK